MEDKNGIEIQRPSGWSDKKWSDFLVGNVDRFIADGKLINMPIQWQEAYDKSEPLIKTKLIDGKITRIKNK